MGTGQPGTGPRGPVRCSTRLQAGAECCGAGERQCCQLLPNSTLLSLCSLRQEQWMNVRVGDIIKLENNQFVAVSVAPRQAWSQLGSMQGQQHGVVLHPLWFSAPPSSPGVQTSGTHQPGSCI